jgi:VWFA-related protein
VPILPAPFRAGAFAAPVLASVAVCAASLPVHAQPRERTLYVSAVDAAGAPVATLAPTDVRVSEDGVAREVLRVAPATDPMQIALLADNTAVVSDQINDYRTALKAFVRKFQPPTEIAYFTFGDRPTVVTEYTTSQDAVLKGIDRLFPQPSAGSYVVDAIADAARGMQKREAARPVIVVVSSDGTEFSNRNHDQVLDLIKAANAQLFVISVHEGGGNRDAATTDEGRWRAIVYDRGTRETGGRREILLSSMGLEDALVKLADELLHQYKVVYSRPSTLIPPEKTTVNSARDGVTIRGVLARAGQGN